MRTVATCAFVAVTLCAVFLMEPSHGQENAAAVEDVCDPPHLATDVRPNEGGPPDEVMVGMRLADLHEINDVAQTLTGDYLVAVSWVDPRLAGLEGCEIPLDDVWDPGLVFTNSGRLFTSRPMEVNIGADGHVRYVQRYFGTIASYHSLQEFPFDRQEIVVSLLPIEASADEVMLVVDEKLSGVADRLNISDWTVNSATGSVNDQFVDAYDRHHARYDLTISTQRISDYYVWKVLLPLALIVAMSWSVFWINPAHFGTQIGLSATAMLTLIAFIFATSNVVPKLGYFTILDRLINVCTIVVFLALIQSLTTTYLVAKDRVALAGRIDQICRVAFPVMFALLVVVVLKF